MNKLYYGVFEWNSDIRFYKEENAVAVYMNEKLAQKKADKLNITKNAYVVRWLYIDTEN